MIKTPRILDSTLPTIIGENFFAKDFIPKHMIGPSVIPMIGHEIMNNVD